MMATTSVESLQATVSDYKVHIKEIAALHQETEQCIKEIQEHIKTDEENPFEKLIVPQFDFANRLPCVLFIGSQNCGKSTLLNTFLEKHNLLPHHETPCTSRIVRILYSETNYVKVVDANMKVLETKKFKKKVPKDLIALKDTEREDEEQLRSIVEVGLNHPLLECGIELLDSPGRNENESIDQVTEEFIKKGIVPLIVYIVDGNHHIRETDRNTIRELQNKFPNVSLIFVCSKVDKDGKAAKYDDDASSDEDSDSDYMNPNQEIIQLSKKKKTEVFRQLKELSFLSNDDQIDSSLHFHGVSARNVKSARKRCRKNYDTKCFERFQRSILLKLENSLKMDCKKALDDLLTTQEMILQSTVCTRRSLSQTVNLVPTVCDQATTIELLIFQSRLKLNFKGDEIGETIRRSLEQLTRVFMDDGEHYRTHDQGTLMKEFQTIKETAMIDPELLKQYRVEELLVMEFTSTMKGAILDKTFNILKFSMQELLREGLSEAVGEMIKLTQTVRSPLIGRLVKRIFGGASAQSERDINSFLQLHVVLDGLLEGIDAAISSTLRQEISIPLSEFDVTDVGKNPNPRDAYWRRKVVQTLLSKIEYKHVAKKVIETCDESMLSLHQLFRDTVENYHHLKTALECDNLKETLEDLRLNYVPRVFDLAARGYALRYIIDHGQPVLGEEIKSTAHCQIYSCSNPTWLNDRPAMVNVLTKSGVGEHVWQQTLEDCLHSLDINYKLGGERCCNHLQVYGWYFPDPNQMHIVMEKAECDLVTALKQDLSWERRKEVAVDVARGLEAMHSVNHVYLDLKAENIMIADDGTAKLTFVKQTRPLEITKLGMPFHISPAMFLDEGQDCPSAEFDIYAFGSLLWVLSEGTGTKGPNAYSHCQDIGTMRFAVCDLGIRPEKPTNASKTWCDLMTACWNCEIKINGLLAKLTKDINKTH